MTKEEKKAEHDRIEKECAPYSAILKQAVLNEVKNVNKPKRPLRVYYQLVSKKDGYRINLCYDDTTDLYQFNLTGFSNMIVSMPLLEFSKLAYQLELSYHDEARLPAPAFLDKKKMIEELESNRQACEVADITNDEILIYLPGNKIRDGYFIRKADKVSISVEKLSDDGTFLIAPFIPDYLLNGTTEPDIFLKPGDEETFKRGYLSAVSEFEHFIFTQRGRFKKPGELAEAMTNTKGAMVD